MKIHQPCYIPLSQSHLLAWDWLICLLAMAFLLFLSISFLVQEDLVSGLLVTTTCFLCTVQPWLFSTVSQLVLHVNCCLSILIPHGLTHFNRTFCLSKERLLIEWQSLTLIGYFDWRVKTWWPGQSSILGPSSFFLFPLPVKSSTFFCCLWFTFSLWAIFKKGL